MNQLEKRERQRWEAAVSGAKRNRLEFERDRTLDIPALVTERMRSRSKLQVTLVMWPAPSDDPTASIVCLLEMRPRSPAARSTRSAHTIAARTGAEAVSIMAAFLSAPLPAIGHIPESGLGW